jgi:hypothetical protein
MAILMKIRCSILALTYGKPIGMKNIEDSEFSSQLMYFIPQIKKLDIMLDLQI